MSGPLAAASLLSRWRGAGLKTRILHPNDELWDRRLGVSTFGYIPAVGEPDSTSWQAHYQPTSYKDLFSMLRRIEVGPGDVYVDLGCGLGRTVFAAHSLGVRRAIGVEVDASLARACRVNAARARGGREGQGVEFFEGYAQDFPQPETTALFMFHPFGPGTLAEVLERLRGDLAAHPRRLRLAYFNAVSDDVLQACGFLRRVDRWVAGEHWSPTTGAYTGFLLGNLTLQGMVDRGGAACVLSAVCSPVSPLSCRPFALSHPLFFLRHRPFGRAHRLPARTYRSP